MAYLLFSVLAFPMFAGNDVEGVSLTAKMRPHPECPMSKHLRLNPKIYEAIPIDLIKEGSQVACLPKNAQGLARADLERDIEENCSKEGRRKTNEFPNFFKAETTEYGQLKGILESNDGEQIDSLVVVGPIDKSDFKAIWDCAVYGNLEVLNLEGTQMKDNEVPDYALYDFIQFEIGFWLKMRRIILPEGIERIGKAAFALIGLSEINIPSTVREIGSSVFSYDARLNCQLTIPEGVEVIQYQSFYECRGLTMAPILPSTLKRIETHAFANTSIEDITFPSNLEVIDMCAFQSTAIKSAHLPDSCISLGMAAFQLCINLTELTLPLHLETISDSAFSYCYSLEKVDINSYCKNIEEDAFLCCINLAQVSLNNGLKYIGARAFNSCELTEIALPPTLEKLEFGCFADVVNVSCAATIPPLCESHPEFSDDWPFGTPHDMEKAELYVPIGTADLYSRAAGWEYFGEIIETDDFPWCSVTGIDADRNPLNGTLYDLNGQKVANPIPGSIYITDGMKILF